MLPIKQNLTTVNYNSANKTNKYMSFVSFITAYLTTLVGNY